MPMIIAMIKFSMCSQITHTVSVVRFETDSTLDQIGFLIE